ncbi:MAG: phosphatase PAP2 family protein [Rhizobiaceae bacterium]|nr:phosphatase PAP2 family protein [Rhizobiaceae bacterium]
MMTVSHTNRIITAALLAGMATIAIFNFYPLLDIELTSVFALGNRRFVFLDIGIIEQLRTLTMGVYVSWYFATIIALIVTMIRNMKIFGLAARDWFYVVMCSAIGPGILANLVFKNYSGRARPRNVEEFGGVFDFTPVANWSNECGGNCSFISGEVSSMVMLFAPLIFICAKRRRLLVAAMFIFGGLSGLMRIGQGGHFTSDCIMAGIFMVLTAAVLYKVFYPQKLDPSG